MLLLYWWWAIGFAAHWLTLAIDEDEMMEYKVLPFWDKITPIILNTALGFFTMLYFLFNYIPQFLKDETNNEEINDNTTIK